VPLVGQPKASADGEARRTFDLPDQDVRVLLRTIADAYEIGVIVPDTLRGRSSMKLRDVTWEQAFRAILDPTDWTYRRDGDVILVVSKKQEPKAEPPSEDLLSIASAMQARLAKELLQDKEYAEAVAVFYRNLYDALVRKGFSKEQAMQIIVSAKIPPSESTH
jgi:type II secretory pathway component HofQ